MTVVEYLRERPAPVLPQVSEDRVTATGTAARGLVLRVPPWCWPALLTLVLGFYQVRPA